MNRLPPAGWKPPQPEAKPKPPPPDGLTLLTREREHFLARHISSTEHRQAKQDHERALTLREPPHKGLQARIDCAREQAAKHLREHLYYCRSLLPEKDRPTHDQMRTLASYPE